MDIAMTGSTGFIGTALVASLEGSGHRVLRLVRPETIPVPRGAVRWDPPAGRIDAGALEGVDAVIHLAGVSIGSGRGTKKNMRAIEQSRSIPTTLLARTLASLRRPPMVLLSQSGVGYYGDRRDDLLDESQPRGSDFLARVCGVWEAATEHAALGGIRVVRMRTGLVLDPSGSLLKRMLLPSRFGLAARLGDGKQRQSWITLSDQIAAMTYLLTADTGGPVNLATPNPVTNADLTEAIARAVGKKVRLAIPQRLLDAGLGKELARSLTASQRVDPARLLSTGFRFEHEQIGDALAALLSRPQVKQP